MQSNENALAAFGSRPAPVLSPEARNLLRAYDYHLLGDGNATAGMNTLVSMIGAICDVAGPDAKIVNEAGNEFPVGMSWLVAGTLSPALHASKVLSPLWKLQSNLSQNAELAEKKRAEFQKAQRPKTVSDMTGTCRPMSPITDDMLLKAKDRLMFGNLIGDPSRHADPDLEQAASAFLQPRAFSNLPELARNPAVIHSGIDAKALSKELVQSHRRHPLVDFPVNSGAEADAIQGACLGVIDGTCISGKFPAPVRGFCTARMQQAVFEEVAKQSDPPSWLTRMLWLTDMRLVGKAVTGPKLKLDQMLLRYENALNGILVARLGEKTTSIKWDLKTEIHHEWVAHLGKLESDFPGISGALVNLVSCLNYGLYKLMVAGARPDGFSFSLEAVLSLAKHLVARMVHQRNLLQDEELTAYRRKIAGSILTKLGSGPHTDIELVRRHNKLPIGTCREVLAGLQSAGLVRRVGDRWELPPDPQINSPTPPVIDVP